MFLILAAEFIKFAKKVTKYLTTGIFLWTVIPMGSLIIIHWKIYRQPKNLIL